MKRTRTHQQPSHSHTSRPFFSNGSHTSEATPFFSASSRPVTQAQPKREVDAPQELEEVQMQAHDAELESAQHAAGEAPLPSADSNTGAQVQTKLAIGQPNDQYEQEADRVAEQVMRMPEPNIHQMCPECEEEMQRQPKTPSGEPLTVSNHLQEQITGLRQRGGQPLPAAERSFFESRFGHDFSQAKVHTNSRDADMASAINSRALHTAPVQIMRDLFQQSESACDVPTRQSMALPQPSCCMLPMLREIWNFRAQAIPIAWGAYRKLWQPDHVRNALWDHFRVRPDDVIRLATIRNQFDNMLNAMFAEDIQFMCRDMGDPACHSRRAAAENCSSTSPRHMWFCGWYVFATMGSNYLGQDWLKTVLHEYVHIGCNRVGDILPEGSEYYSYKPGYPPADPNVAIRNADSYANFALAVR